MVGLSTKLIWKVHGEQPGGPYKCLLFIMVYTEVNVYLTIKYFQKNDETFMDFGKMANALIHNSYINYCLIGLNELFFLQTFENKIK